MKSLQTSPKVSPRTSNVLRMCTLSECLFFFRFLSISNARTWARPENVQLLMAILHHVTKSSRRETLRSSQPDCHFASVAQCPANSRTMYRQPEVVLQLLTTCLTLQVQLQQLLLREQQFFGLFTALPQFLRTPSESFQSCHEPAVNQSRRPQYSEFVQHPPCSPVNATQSTGDARNQRSRTSP